MLGVNAMKQGWLDFYLSRPKFEDYIFVAGLIIENSAKQKIFKSTFSLL